MRRIAGLDASDASEPLFRTEPFCGVLGETGVVRTDPVQFLEAATVFLNERMWGTLNVMLLIQPAPVRTRRWPQRPIAVIS